MILISSDFFLFPNSAGLIVIMTLSVLVAGVGRNSVAVKNTFDEAVKLCLFNVK